MKMFNVIWSTYGSHWGIEETFNTLKEAEDYLEYLAENEEDSEVNFEIVEVK
jgi:hypothetical protein